MSISPAEGLLHLAALSSALCIAYVGLDKIHKDDQTISNEISAAKQMYAEIIQEFDPVRKVDGKVKLECRVMAVYVLCYISEGDLPKEWWRSIVLPVFTFWHFPFVNYFRRRADLTFVSLLAIMSTLFFLSLSASMVYPIELFDNISVCRLLYWYYFFTVAWIFVTVLLSTRIMKIKETGARLRRKIRDRLKEFGDGQIDDAVSAASNPSIVVKPGSSRLPP